MKRKIIIYILIITLCITTFTYKVFADNILSILSINKTNNIDEDIIIKVNIDSIEYNKFKFILSSSDTIENIDTDTNIDIISDNNEISFEYDKTNSNINDISLSYKISNNHNINDKITFNVKIINLENTEEVLEESYEVLLTTKEESNINNDTSNIKPIKDENSNSNSPKNENTNNKDNTSNKNNIPSNTNKDILNISTKKTNTNSKQVVQNISTTKVITTTKTISASSVSNIQKITYKGSDNNYLTNISIKGYELNKEFKKESNTYFITVDSDTYSISINTSKEDSSSTVSITGNDNLTTGLNKVLINVTAENGNIRTYRIYVTKESE